MFVYIWSNNNGFAEFLLNLVGLLIREIQMHNYCCMTIVQEIQTVAL